MDGCNVCGQVAALVKPHDARLSHLTGRLNHLSRHGHRLNLNCPSHSSRIVQLYINIIPSRTGRTVRGQLADAVTSKVVVDITLEVILITSSPPFRTFTPTNTKLLDDFSKCLNMSV